jgi:drug/metabolite transporter (DMT)-like permease
MNNTLLYIVTVLIWGTTWFAIKLQIGHAPNEISIFYRAALAALLMLTWCKFKGYSLRFNLTDHIFLFGLGLSMFSLHYLFLFNAMPYLISGVSAVVFSSVSFLSIVNNFVFFRIKPTLNICLGALTGVIGLCIFFWSDLSQLSEKNDFIKGLLLAAIATFIFSLGSSISKRNNNQGLEIIPAMTMAMVYGALFLLVYILTLSIHFVVPESSIYWASIIYLVIPGSIIAFLCYLKLIKNIGPALAGYILVLTPLVALVVSWLFEDYEWSLMHAVGIAFVVIGNVLIMQKKPLMQIFAAQPTPNL